MGKQSLAEAIHKKFIESEGIYIPGFFCINDTEIGFFIQTDLRG